VEDIFVNIKGFYKNGEWYIENYILHKQNACKEYRKIFKWNQAYVEKLGAENSKYKKVKKIHCMRKKSLHLVATRC
jgi:hypothetical protein